jgi:hypothetical protein
MVGQIDRLGHEAFTLQIIEELELNNPELLQMAHDFASKQRDYLGAMQGLALFYRSIVEEAKVAKLALH